MVRGAVLRAAGLNLFLTRLPTQMQIVFAVFCLEAEHMASVNVSKFNWDFDQIHRGGWRVME